MVGSTAWSTSIEDPAVSRSPRARARRPAAPASPFGDLSFATEAQPETLDRSLSNPLEGLDAPLSYAPDQPGVSTPDRMAQATPGHQAPAPQATPAPSAFRSTTQFKTTLDELNATTDPRRQAVLRDKLSRDLSTSLQQAGHKVSFKGDQLIVDGRTYIVGGGNGQPGTDLMGPNGPANGNTGVAGRPAAAPGAPSVGHDGMTTSGLSREQYRDLWQGSGASSMADLERYVAEHGGQILSGNGTVRTPFGEDIEMLENARGNADGRGPAKPSWAGVGPTAGPSSAGGGGARAALAGGRGDLASVLDSFSFQGLDAAPGGDTLAAPRGADSFEASLDRLSERLPLGSTGPGYTPGGMEDSALETDTDALVRELLQNPESLDPQTLEILKAQSREELADLAEGDDEAMRAMGTEMGIEDSNWLASERLARRDSRNNAIVSGNRSLDVEAATRRGEDKRSAASLGMSASAQKAQKQAMRESFKQKAAELGMSEAQVRLDHTRTLLSAVGAKYGIDVGASLDLKKLALMDVQFQEELAYKLQALAQADEQFGAELGLSYDQLNSNNDQNAFENWFKTTFADIGGN